MTKAVGERQEKEKRQRTCSSRFAGQYFDLGLKLGYSPLCIFCDCSVRLRQVCAALLTGMRKSRGWEGCSGVALEQRSYGGHVMLLLPNGKY